MNSPSLHSAPATCASNRLPWLRRLCGLLLFLLLAPAVRAQTHAWELNGSYADTYSGSSMLSAGGTLNATNYSFAAGQGPGVQGVLPAGSDYSLEMVFTLTSVPTWACMMNFSNLTADAGIYLWNGSPYFAPNGGSPTSPVIGANSATRVFITRSFSSQVTSIYVNGALAATRTDTGNNYFPSAAGYFHFFRDNTSGGSTGENAPGMVDQIRIYNYALSAGEVATRGSVGPAEIDVFRGPITGTALTDGGSTTDFGSMQVGNASAAQTFTIRNAGSLDLTGLSVVKNTVNGSWPNHADFNLSWSGGTILAPGHIATFTVAFSPTATGGRNAEIDILSSDFNESTFETYLTGTGTPAPVVTMTHEYEFSGNYNDTLGTRNLTAGSGGTVASSYHQFTQNNGPRLTFGLNNPAEYTIEMVFQLDAVSGYRALVNFDDAASDRTVFVRDGKLNFYPLSGGPQSSSAVFTAAQTQRFVLTRSATTKQVSGYVNGTQVLSATDTADAYVSTNTAGGNPLRFFTDNNSEASAGLVDQIRIYDTPMTPGQVAVLGSGLAPEIQVLEGGTLAGAVNRRDNAAAYVMPATGLGSSSSFQLVIHNTGTSNLTGLFRTMGGSHPGDFVPTNFAGSTLGPGQTMNFQVSFTPTAQGTRTATLNIYSDDADETIFEVNFTATALLPPTVTGISPANGSATGGTQVTITGANFTGAAGGASGVTIGGTAAAGVNVVNGTTITCTTLARNAGPASVVVTTPGGTNAANTLYSYKAVTTTTLALTGGGSAPYGQAAPVTATVTATNQYQTPLGSVSLKEGAVILASTTRVTPGTWTFTPAGLNVGSHIVTAQYDGDAWNLLSTTAASVTINITQATGALALTSSLNPMTQSAAVTFTATLTPPLNGVTLTFKDGATTLGTAVTNAAGTASFAPAPPMLYGTRAITAVFAGNTNVSATTSPVLSQVVNQNANAIVLTNLSVNYDGTPKSPTAITVPANRTVNFTYADGAYPSTVNLRTTPPTAVGTYSAVGTISDPVWGGTAGATFVINKGNATVTISNVNRIFDGTPKPVTVTTVPAGLSHTVTYNGSTTAPSALGSYAVVATVTDPNWLGSDTDTLDISNAAVTTTTLSSSLNPSVFLTQPTFTARATSATAGLNGQMELLIDNVLLESRAVDAGGYATFTPPAAALRGGARAIRAVYNGSRTVIEFASSNATLTQTVNKAPLAVTLGSLSQVYDGTAKAATATTATLPATHTSVQIDFTYDGSPVQPVNAGSYAVVATINDPSLQGTDSGTLTITKAPALAGFTSPAAVGYDGLPHPVIVITDPAVPVTITYQPLVNGTPTGTAVPTPPSAVGSYRAALTNPNYTLNPATTDLTITSRGFSITLGDLSVVGDGTPKPVTVVTDPPGINVAVTYQAGAGAATATPPSAPPPGGGTWRVNASATDANYAGTATADLLIRVRQIPVITVNGPATAYPGSTTFTINIQASPTGFAPPGLITFKQDGAVLGTARLGANGTCSWPTTLWARGAPYAMTAAYEGDPDFFSGNSSPRLTTVSKRVLEVRPDSPLIVTYDGSPKRVAFTTDLSGTAAIPILVTYAGHTTPLAGAFDDPIPVLATIDPADPFYQGTVAVALRINRAPATISLGNLDHLYDRGRPLEATATVQPAGLFVVLTYNDSETPPYAVGEYQVRARLIAQNHTAADAYGILRIVDSGVSFDVGGLYHDYDGSEKTVSVSATPAISYTVTYNGLPGKPRAAGRYFVEVAANQPPYVGRVTKTMNIRGLVTAVSKDDGQQSAVGTFKLDDTDYLEPGATGSLAHFPIFMAPGYASLKFVGNESDSVRWRFKEWEDGSTNSSRSIFVGGPSLPGAFTFTATATREDKLAGIPSPASAGNVFGGGWKAAGDVAQFNASPANGYALEYWTYNNVNLPGRLATGAVPQLEITVVRGGGSPVAHFTQGYTAEAVSDFPEKGSAKLVRADRPQDAPLQSTAVPNGINFIATATPRPGYRFAHWSAHGATPVGSGLSGLSYANPATFAATGAFAQAIPKFISIQPEFAVDVTEVKKVWSAQASGAVTLAGVIVELKNVGGAHATQVRITGVRATGYRLEEPNGSYDEHYPDPATNDEVAANAASQFSTAMRNILSVHSPIFLGDSLSGESEVGTLNIGQTKEDGNTFNWSSAYNGGPVYENAFVRLTFTIEYDGGVAECDTWEDMKVLEEW